MNSPYLTLSKDDVEAVVLDQQDFVGCLFALKSLQDVYQFQAKRVKVFLGEERPHTFLCDYEILFPQLTCRKPVFVPDGASFLDFDATNRARVVLDPSYDPLQVIRIYLFLIHLFSKSRESKDFFRQFHYLDAFHSLEEVDAAILDQYDLFDKFFTSVIQYFKPDIAQSHIELPYTESLSGVMTSGYENDYDSNFTRSLASLKVEDVPTLVLYKLPCESLNNVNPAKLKKSVDLVNSAFVWLLYMQQAGLIQNLEPTLVDKVFFNWFKLRRILFALLRPLTYLQDPVFGRGGGHYKWNCFADINQHFSGFSLRVLSGSTSIDTASLNQLAWIASRASQSLLDLVGKIFFASSSRRDKENGLRQFLELLSRSTDDVSAFQAFETLPVSRSEEFDRGELRKRELERIGFFSLVPVGETVVYLDFGGGDGQIAAALAKKMSWVKSNVFVSDIVSWFGNIKEDAFKTQVTYRYLKSSILPFKSDSFDLVTAFQVLHHLAEVRKSLSEVRRILKKGGIFMIREHDCRGDEDRVLIDLEHSLREMVLNKQGPEYLERYFAKYFSRDELAGILQQEGFERAGLETEPRGPTRQYYTAWKKV